MATSPTSSKSVMPKSSFLQPVSSQDMHQFKLTKPFSMIDNYVYLYHTKTLIAIPTYPQSVNDTMNVSYNPTSLLARSAPIFTYQNSGPRQFELSIPLHRDMMNQINVESSNLKIPNLQDEDYVDIMIKQLQAAAVPRYAASEKMVDPPLVAVRFGTDIFCKGVVSGSVGVTYDMPILVGDKYALVTVSFQVQEVDPYDADTVMKHGSYRGLRKTLESSIWKTK